MDGSLGAWRDAVEITFGGEPVVGKSPECAAPLPSDYEVVGTCRVLKLNTLVQFQLARYRLDDAVDLRDLIDVGLLDPTWVARNPDPLASRLQVLFDTPDG